MREDFEHAPHDTRLGRLQRGRGRGFLEAIAAGDAARNDVLRCIVDDPRVDTQVEDRPRYYADLVIALAVPVEAIAASLPEHESDTLLPHEVLAACWCRGHDPARSLLASPSVSDHVLQGVAAAVCGNGWPREHDVPPRLRVAIDAWERQWNTPSEPDPPRRPVPADASVDELLALAGSHRGEGSGEQILAALCRRDSAEDRTRLSWHVEHGPCPRLAARALGRLGDERLLPLAEALFAHDDEPLDPVRALPAALRIRRRWMLLYVRELPPAITLPLARAWHPRGDYFETVAGSVLAQHAEAADREWLERLVLARIDDDHGSRIVSELDAVAHVGDPRSAPVLLAVSEQVRYGWARCAAVRALARMPDAPGAAAALREALWDSEDDAAEAAVVHAPELDATCRDRVAGLAQDRLAIASLQEAAARRAANGR